MQTPNPDIPNIPKTTPNVDVRLSFGPARPLVLFPVRLETRFFPQADGSVELRVRVYPDKVHIDSHETKLTEDEVIWGKHFWEQIWRTGTADDPAAEERRKAAWRQLADRFDPPRAAWIARQLTPQNPQDRPRTPIATGQPLPKAPIFRTLETKPEAWTEAPQARALPNQWIVLGYKNGNLIVNQTGLPISDPLAAGPNPSKSATVDQFGLDEGMKWMVDFASAEKVGMGIRIKLTKEIAAAGFDFLLVMGIRDTLDAAKDWTPQLTQLFDAHHYTSGLSFLRPGTPSNNTPDAPSGFSSKDPGQETSYATEVRAPAIKRGDKSNADLLTNAFGLTNATQLFANLPNATQKDQLDAQHMNTALWSATWGYFLLQMLGVGRANESPLGDDDIAWARNHFIEFVRANGPLPTLRIGRQPYGILPVTSLNEWKPRAGQETQSSRDVALCAFLRRMRNIWRRNFIEVPRLGRSPDTPQENGFVKDLEEVLSMDGQSSSYSMQHMMGRQYLEHLWVFLTADFYADVWDPELPEIPELEEPPEIEEPDPDMSPRQRAEFIRRQQAARQAFIRRQEQIRAAAARARRLRFDFIENKRLATTTWFQAQERLAAAALQTLELAWRPRLQKAVFSPPLATLEGPLVQADHNTSLTPNYIDSLLAIRDFVKKTWFTGEKFEQPAPHTLLHLLLRHSMLLEYHAAALRLLAKKTPLRPDRREPELLNLQEGQITQTIWEQMKTPISVSATETLSLGNYLFGTSGDPDVARDPELTSLKEFRASLTHLRSPNIDVAKLEQLMTGTLDLCSHRLDAWITSFATKRLADMRQRDPSGVLFGGYGWVMNLTPAAAQTPIATPPGEEGPVFQMSNNPGFIHTPSLGQAATVAVLRSGHLAHATSGANDLLAIDLSSERVRLASWLLDGVRQGQPLGALLGYRFERRLQEVGKPQFIALFRELAPLVAKKLEQTNQPVEQIAANNVVDGLALMRRWQKGKGTNPPQWNIGTIPFGQRIGQQRIAFPPFDPNNADFKAVQSELLLLEEAVDAVSDALMAESVHQAVRGNPLRTATTVESIAGGETPPPELEVVRTPRSGIGLTHRIVTLFSGDPQLPNTWAAPANPFRANAEPHLNAWAAKLLVNPANVRCLVERLDPTSLQPVETKELRLDELQLAPLDYIYASDGGAGGQQAELELRILFAITKKENGFPAGSLLRVSPKRKADWAPHELSYGQFSEVLRTARKLFTGVRALDPADLTAPAETTEVNADVLELDRRAASAVQSLRQLSIDFGVQPTPPDLDSLRNLLLRAAAFGIAGAMPLSARGDLPPDRELLLAQSDVIQKEVAQRLDQLKTLETRFRAGPQTADDKRNYALDRLHLVFGKAFIVLPRFMAVNADELAKALDNSDQLQGGDPLASVTWFRRMSRVRETVNQLNAALNYAEVLNTGEKLKLRIAQLPHADDDRWVALPLDDGKSLPGGKLSIAVQSAAAVDARKPLAGLLIDEWVEVVPGTTEVTGLSLQYDQPSAAPPQSILLAVPPDLESPWTIWSLQQVLLETLDLARIRAVDLSTLNEVGHYLPALYFAYNLLGDAVSTDFTTIR